MTKVKKTLKFGKKQKIRIYPSVNRNGGISKVKYSNPLSSFLKAKYVKKTATKERNNPPINTKTESNLQINPKVVARIKEIAKNFCLLDILSF